MKDINKKLHRNNDFTLSKIYSREKPLFYFSMWNDSDRLGWKNFLNYNVKHSLFIISPPGEKGSVWYSSEELDNIQSLLKEKLKNDPSLIKHINKTLNSSWVKLFPYLNNSKKLKSIKEFKKYYHYLIVWWSAMNTAFKIPDLEEIDDDIRKNILSYRKKSEKYTEKMSSILTKFFEENWLDLAKFSWCIEPMEVVKAFDGLDKNILPKIIKERRFGCIILDGKVYPMKGMSKLLSKNNLFLKKDSIGKVKQIKGISAYHGKKQGQIKKILSFSDMNNFKAGEILVTEMTNPNYLPAMKKASAIITDEGGITCHAAIVAREMKKPCIIGTKIATQVLQDGDKVEVDANQGIIKII